MPDLATSAEGLAALAAVRASLGGGEDADNAVVQAVLAAGAGDAVSPAEALAAGAAGGADAPLVPVSEQEVYAVNQDADDSALVAVYPTEGSPSLDYPVLRVGAPSGDAARGRRRRRAGADLRRGPHRRPARPASAAATARRRPAPARRPASRRRPRRSCELDPAEVQALLARLSSLATPSRILAVFDVSTSMEAPVGDGTRATLARDAAQERPVAGARATTRSACGSSPTSWTATGLGRAGAHPRAGRRRRRAARSATSWTSSSTPSPTRLAPGGTGLYDTTLAAVRAARANYDPTAVNSVLLLTDGTNEDDDAASSWRRCWRRWRAEADPTRPIKVIGVALGPDADLAALEQIAEATGGAAYSAVDPTDLQTVLFDALRQRG